MKLVITVIRFLVGLLFIFSGAIKLNDPFGFSYKLVEYFEVFAADFGSVFHLFIPYALVLSILICILEIVLGVAMLLGYRMVITMWATLLLIVFFTFLTFYSAYFDKVRECGCFGDFVHLSPWQSFYKDLVLLGLIAVLFFDKEKIKPVFGNLADKIVVGAVSVLCLFAAYYSVKHLPFIDMGVYAPGNNIAKLMKAEESPKFIYVFEKDGKQVELEKYPSDPSYKYINYRILNPDKSVPKILDYRIWNEEGDFTDSTLTGSKVFIIVRDAASAVADRSTLKNAEKLGLLIPVFDAKGIKPLILTASVGEDIENFRHEAQIAASYYFMDDTQLKTILRANFGIILLKNGIIVKKWHQNDIPDKDQLNSILD